MRFRSFASLLLLFVACTRTEIPPPVAPSESRPTSDSKTAPIPEPSAEEVQHDVRVRTEATFADDADTMLRYLSQKEIESQGGIESARETIQIALTRMREMGAKLESLAFHAPPEFVTTAERTYAIVPVTGVFSLDGSRRVRSVDFHFGVREKGSDRFLDYRVGSQLDIAELRAEYPDFPADYEFPETSASPLEPVIEPRTRL